MKVGSQTNHLLPSHLGVFEKKKKEIEKKMKNENQQDGTNRS
jgi:hypothetical protein